MIQLYDRDAADITALLSLLIEFRSQEVGDAYDRLRAWAPADIVETDTEIKRALVNARIESIVAAIKEQAA